MRVDTRDALDLYNVSSQAIGLKIRGLEGPFAYPMVTIEGCDTWYIAG